jgi:hypothetical protein
MKNKSTSLKYVALAGCLLLFTGLTMNSCKKNSTSAPHVNPIDPDSAAGNATLYVTGSGLSDITSILFSNDSVPAPFNNNFNTDGAIIFRVPDTAFGGPQNIIFTNKRGQVFSTPFNVLAFPNIKTVSNYNFNTGDTLTLTGSNLEAVTSVAYLSSKTQAKILSESHHTLQVVMPASTNNTEQLVLTNATGSDTATQQFVNRANAFIIYAKGNYGDNIALDAWGSATQSTTVTLGSYPTYAATYSGGSWNANGFANWNAPYFPSSGYQNFTFWVYSDGTAAYTFYITSAGAAAGYGNSDVSNPITIPPQTWTYFNLNISKLGIATNSSASFNQLGWMIQNGLPSGAAPVTLYFDDVMFTK